MATNKRPGAKLLPDEVDQVAVGPSQSFTSPSQSFTWIESPVSVSCHEIQLFSGDYGGKMFFFALGCMRDAKPGGRKF